MTDQTPLVDPFDPKALRLPQDFKETASVKKLLETIPVRRFNNQDFFRTHPDEALFKLLTYDRVRLLSGVLGHGAGLLCELDIGVTRRVASQHDGVARQYSRDADLLCRPVDVDNGVPRRRLDQSAKPDARAEDKTCVARRVPSGTCAESG